MIYSRSNLAAALITAKQPPILNNVHMAEGTTVAFDGKLLVAVSPVNERVKKEVPLPESEAGTLTVSAETIKEVLKNMPTDKRFHGLLEHCDVTSAGKFALTDGKRSRSITGKVFAKDFLDYKSVFQKAKSSPVATRVVLNRHRLKQMLDFLDKACPDGSNEAPVYLEFSEDRDVIARAQNPINGQRAIGYLTSYKAEEGQWLEPDEWERGITGEKEAPRISTVQAAALLDGAIVGDAIARGKGIVRKAARRV